MPPAALAEKGVSLYLHLPFCVRKCRYCDFNSWAWTGQSLDRHVRALLAEARMRAAGLKPQTVFVGGGTPTFLPPGLLAELLEELDSITGFRASAREVTLEANPESFDAPTARAAQAAGVDRVSIGIQSLRPEVLRAYDRVHDAAEALAAFRRARDAGFRRVNADLIFNFPGQDPAAWDRDLSAVLELEPEHVSCYELTLEPGTALTRLRDAGRWQAGNPETGRLLFERTRDLCGAAGLGQYEVSNFARPGEACLHNLAYWRSLTWVGLGAGAVSWDGRARRSNLESPASYERSVLAGEDPVAAIERPSAAVVHFDNLMMGLRLLAEGAESGRARRAAGEPMPAAMAAELAALEEEGLLERSGSHVRATPAGLPFLDSILERLLPGPPL